MLGPGRAVDRCEERKGLGAERELSVEVGELAC